LHRIRNFTKYNGINNKISNDNQQTNQILNDQGFKQPTLQITNISKTAQDNQPFKTMSDEEEILNILQNLNLSIELAEFMGKNCNIMQAYLLNAIFYSIKDFNKEVNLKIIKETEKKNILVV
jgi:hypothetical protein